SIGPIDDTGNDVIVRDDMTGGGREEAGADRRLGSGEILDDLDSRREGRKPIEELRRSSILLLRLQGVASSDHRGEEACLANRANGHRCSGEETGREL